MLIRRPRAFALTVILSTLVVVVVMYFVIAAFALGDLPFD